MAERKTKKSTTDGVKDKPSLNAKKTRKKGGPKPFEVSKVVLDKVFKLAKSRTPQYAIAKAIGVCDDKWYKLLRDNKEINDSYKKGRDAALEDIYKTLQERGTSGQRTPQIKTQEEFVTDKQGNRFVKSETVTKDEKVTISDNAAFYLSNHIEKIEQREKLKEFDAMTEAEQYDVLLKQMRKLAFMSNDPEKVERALAITGRRLGVPEFSKTEDKGEEINLSITLPDALSKNNLFTNSEKIEKTE